MTRNRDIGNFGSEAAIIATEGVNFYKTYSLPSTVSVADGTKRFYLFDAATLTNINAYAGTAPAGASLNLRINKNGSSAETISISDGSTSSTNTASTSFAQGDYVTVDVTQVGSSTAGSDVKVNFIFRKT